MRHPNPLDHAIIRFDRILKSAVGPHPVNRPFPAADVPESITDSNDKKQIARLIRVNHAGEICAQALYHGQALTARSAEVRTRLEHAADEESDHLAWCTQRLEELGDRPSMLDPLWYLGSFAIGVVAGLSGDKRSLGFVAETENQVIEHLQSHLDRLPAQDARTRALINQMMSDEARHGGEALAHGGELPPGPIKQIMKMTARIMTRTSEYI